MNFAQGFVFVLLNLPFMAPRMNPRWGAYLIWGVLIGGEVVLSCTCTHCTLLWTPTVPSRDTQPRPVGPARRELDLVLGSLARGAAL